MTSPESEPPSPEANRPGLPKDWWERRHDWMKVVGMFSPDDEVMKEIVAEGARIREAEYLFSRRFC